MLLAWAILRNHHALLSARVLYGAEILPSEESSPGQRYFVIEPPTSDVRMVEAASDTIIFMEDWYSSMDVADFFKHLMNATRVVDARRALAKLFVLPLQKLDNGKLNLQIFLVAGHQIVDGLAIHRWMAHFIDIINLDPETLKKQADLYPPVTGNIARQRWFWAISRVLRHTRQPPPASFQNPLRRTVSHVEAESLPPSYAKVLDYSKSPPVNSYLQMVKLSPAASQNLIRQCRSARVSIGSGCFALVGLVMMVLEEHRHPSVPLCRRCPFVGSFPVDPRPFIAGEPTAGHEDSLMLAFSDGLTLPFLSSDLPLEGRFRLLAKQAHRQLKQYQKRKRTEKEVVELGSRSPAQLIPHLYLESVERAENQLPPERRQGINPQGAYPAKQSPTPATCSVSSVGSRVGLISSGKYDLEDPTRDFAADFRDQQCLVRARDGEFMVASVGDADVLQFNASYDGNVIDPDMVKMWRRLMEDTLEPRGNQGPKL